jgi:hypothetical protein
MRLTPLARLALLALLGASCVQTYGPPPFYGYPGNIYLSWTFNGAGCAQTPDVVQVMVNVANDPVPIVPNTFACRVGNPPPNQLIIKNYNPGSYAVSLSGLDASGNVIWFGGKTVVVNGNVSTNIDLQPSSGGGNSFAYLSWNFATAVGSAFPPCTGQNESSPDPDRIDSVSLFVDGSNNPAQTYACNQGTGPAQVSTPFLPSGNHSLQLVAFQAGIPYAFAQTAPVTVNFDATNPSSQTFTFSWLVGGVGVAWTYPNANACSAAGIASVTAGFSGAADAGYATTGYPCQPDGGVAPFKHLEAVTTTGPGGVPYALGVDALGSPPSAPVLYQGTLPAVTIQPGHFYDGTPATVVTVPLH